MINNAAKTGLVALTQACRGAAVDQIGIKAKKGIDELARKHGLTDNERAACYQAVVCNALADTLLSYCQAAGKTERERRECLRASLVIFCGHPDIEREIGRVARGRWWRKIRDRARSA